MDIFVAELNALSKNELDRRLAKFGVKPIPKAQAITFLTNVHLALVAKKSASTCGSSRAAKRSKKLATITPHDNTNVADDPSLPSSSAALSVSKAKKIKVKNGGEATKNVTARRKKPSKPLGDGQDGSAVGVDAASTSPVITALSPVPMEPVQKKVPPRQNYKIKLVETSSDEESEHDEGGVQSEVDSSVIVVEKETKRAEGKLQKISLPDAVSDTMLRYIRDRPELYSQILQFETIYLKPFQKQLKADGLNIKSELLMDFFDAQAICFSQHDAAHPRQWGRKKRP